MTQIPTDILDGILALLAPLNLPKELQTEIVDVVVWAVPGALSGDADAAEAMENIMAAVESRVLAAIPASSGGAWNIVKKAMPLIMTALAA